MITLNPRLRRLAKKYNENYGDRLPVGYRFNIGYGYMGPSPWPVRLYLEKKSRALGLIHFHRVRWTMVEVENTGYHLTNDWMVNGLLEEANLA